MPLMEYRCSGCGHRFEELFLGSEPVAESLSCRCGSDAKKHTVYRVRVIGPVFEDMEGWNRRLLSESDRRNGRELKSYSDILAREAELGVERMDRDGVAHKTVVEDLRDRASTIRRVRDEDGMRAADSWVDRESLKDELGWDDTKAREYQEMSNAAERDFKSGKFDEQGAA